MTIQNFKVEKMGPSNENRLGRDGEGSYKSAAGASKIRNRLKVHQILG